MAVDADLDVFQVELGNCLSKIKEENEGSKRQLEDLGIHLIPERSQLEAIADFQILHKIDEIDDISIGIGVSESVLKGIKQAEIQRELKKESHRLKHQHKQLSKCKEMLTRDEKLYREEKKVKEEISVRLKTDNVLLQPELDKYIKAMKELQIQENSINSSFKEIKDFNQKIRELDQQLQAEEVYLRQFAGLPPSLSEAANRVQEIKEKNRKVDIVVQKNLTRS